MPMKYGKTMLQRLENSGSIVILDAEEGDYSITVSPLSIRYVIDLLNSEIGTGNYKQKYNADRVNFTIDFNIHGKKKEVAAK
jgi:hypothetical protein